MHNIKVVFENGKVKLFNGNDIVGIGFRDNLYKISFKVIRNECLNIEIEDEKTKLWHKRYYHISYTNLRESIEENMVHNIQKLKLNKIEFCESCINGKMTRLGFRTRNKSNRILEIIHSDVCGPIDSISYDGSKYFLTFIDDYSNFIYVHGIKRKDEVTMMNDTEYDTEYDGNEQLRTGNSESETGNKRTRDKRNIRLPKRFEEYKMYMVFNAISFVEQVPKDSDLNSRDSDLNSRGDRNLWKEAMNREIESINKNNTWK